MICKVPASIPILLRKVISENISFNKSTALSIACSFSVTSPNNSCITLIASHG